MKIQIAVLVVLALFIAINVDAIDTNQKLRLHQRTTATLAKKSFKPGDNLFHGVGRKYTEVDPVFAVKKDLQWFGTTPEDVWIYLRNEASATILKFTPTETFGLFTISDANIKELWPTIEKAAPMDFKLWWGPWEHPVTGVKYDKDATIKCSVADLFRYVFGVMGGLDAVSCSPGGSTGKGKKGVALKYPDKTKLSSFKIGRTSRTDFDYALTEFLCAAGKKQGFKGYWAPKLEPSAYHKKKWDVSKMHEELTICEPWQVLKYLSKMEMTLDKSKTKKSPVLKLPIYHFTLTKEHKVVPQKVFQKNGEGVVEMINAKPKSKQEKQADQKKAVIEKGKKVQQRRKETGTKTMSGKQKKAILKGKKAQKKK